MAVLEAIDTAKVLSEAAESAVGMGRKVAAEHGGIARSQHQERTKRAHQVTPAKSVRLCFNGVCRKTACLLKVRRLGSEMKPTDNEKTLIIPTQNMISSTTVSTISRRYQVSVSIIITNPNYGLMRKHLIK